VRESRVGERRERATSGTSRETLCNFKPEFVVFVVAALLIERYGRSQGINFAQVGGGAKKSPFKTRYGMVRFNIINDTNAKILDWNYKNTTLQLKIIDQKLTRTRGQDPNKLRREPARHALKAVWYPFKRILGLLKYRPPNNLEILNKVKIEEFIVCPAVEYTSIPTLMLERLINIYHNSSWWIQMDKVELSKRHWLWQAIDAACLKSNARIRIEMEEYANGLEARIGHYRNAFRRHLKFPIRIIPPNRTKPIEGVKGTGIAAKSVLRPSLQKKRMEKRSRRLIKKLRKR